MPQDGRRLHACTTGGFIYTEDEVLARLPPHPNPSMCEGYADQTFVLPSNMAPLVSSVLELPPDVDISRVYVGEAFVMGGGPQPFVRAVWYRPPHGGSRRAWDASVKVWGARQSGPNPGRFPFALL